MKMLRVLALGVVVGGISLAVGTNAEAAENKVWTPRSAEQIKAEIKGNEYTIVWGDTLSAISQATNITVQKLADMNKITNVDLIYAGNKLVFNGNVTSIQNSAGETVAQTVIQEKDKVNPSQPVGQGTTSNTQTTPNTTTPTTPAGDQTGTTGGTTTPSTSENNGGTTQTPTQPGNGGNIGGETTPSNPGTGGGTTTPEQPGNPGGGEQGGNGDTTTPEEPTIVEGQIGNSGLLFNTKDEANAAADLETDNPESQWFAHGYVTTAVIYSDGTIKWTINYY
ncbi:LysM peptidoglycan-binding domain-containing protein [Enterococcus faecalis]|uniref:LysM peptidoglycan-binding domain-containing protein n=1 Tax=Enterococcus faecalis TaxID=1351 RepID=UPI00242C5908|nr:LysM domain-containing protein [Enterococcus faecalis]